MEYKNTEISDKEVTDINKLLNESNEILNNYIDVSKTDLNGNITYVSKMFCETMGYNEDELIGKSHNIVKSPYTPSDLYKELWTKLSKNETFTTTIQNQSKTGELIWFEALLKPEYDKAGKKIGYVAYRKNITEQEKLKELVESQVKEIKKREQQLYEQSKLDAMGNMIHNIAHQWRQPLSLISSVASSLSLKLELGIFDKDEAIHNLDELNNSVQYLSNTINDFNTLFQKDNKKTQINIKKLIAEIETIIQIEIRNQNLNIVSNIDENININCYKSDLIQVFLNLIHNAIEVLEEKDYCSRFVFIEAFEDKDNLVMTIADSGGGVEEDIIKNIFEPYFTTKHETQGTGLGLFMIEEIISKVMRGKIVVQNKTTEFEGKSYKGACFTITIPKI